MLCVWMLVLLGGGVAVADGPSKEPGQETQTSLRGVVLPIHQSKLGFTQAGIIIELPLEGTEVKKGAQLARINDREAREKVAKAKAALAGARLKLTQAVHAQEKNKRLHEEKILSDMALKEGEFAITQGKVGVDQAAADLAGAQYALEGTVLLAPFDGVVARLKAHVGEWIGAGAPTMELVDLSRLELSMDVPPDSLGGLEPGMEAGVFINGQQAGVARARTILPLVDAASGLRRVIWSVTPAPGQVMTGRYVTLGRWGAPVAGGKRP